MGSAGVAGPGLWDLASEVGILTRPLATCLQGSLSVLQLQQGLCLPQEITVGAERVPGISEAHRKYWF